MSAARPIIPRIGERLPAGPRFPVSRKEQLRIWWREIDRVLLALVLTLMLIGSVAVAAASPASAQRLSSSSVRLDDLYFFWAHVRWQLVGLAAMFGISLAPRELARRGAILLAVATIIALLLLPLIGSKVNGATRWLDLGMRFQPSEFLKPGYAVLMAWIFSLKMRDPQLPVIGVTAGLMGLVAILLLVQPNLGDAVLFAGAWLAMAMLAGMPMQRIGMFAGGGLALLAMVYLLYDNARNRIDSFLGGGTAFDQVDLAGRTLQGGGWLGAGLWLGRRKMQLPEAHTDYIFSVIGEEFGLLICALVVLLYLAIIARVLVRMLDEQNLFAVLAGAGLVTLMGGQAFINILVNLQLVPSKGMTLPLLSYGGSSTIAQCMTIGLLLAITRRNPFLTAENLAITPASPPDRGANKGRSR